MRSLVVIIILLICSISWASEDIETDSKSEIVCAAELDGGSLGTGSLWTPFIFSYL